METLTTNLDDDRSNAFVNTEVSPRATSVLLRELPHYLHWFLRWFRCKIKPPRKKQQEDESKTNYQEDWIDMGIEERLFYIWHGWQIGKFWERQVEQIRSRSYYTKQLEDSSSLSRSNAKVTSSSSWNLIILLSLYRSNFRFSLCSSFQIFATRSHWPMVATHLTYLSAHKKNLQLCQRLLLITHYNQTGKNQGLDLRFTLFDFKVRFGWLLR